MDGREETEVSMLTDASRRVKKDAKAAGAGKKITALLYNTRTMRDVEIIEALLNEDTEVATPFGGTFGIPNSEKLEKANEPTDCVLSDGKSTRVTRVVLLASGYKNSPRGKIVIRPLGPEKDSHGVAVIGVFAEWDGNTTIVCGTGAVSEPGSKIAEVSRGSEAVESTKILA